MAAEIIGIWSKDLSCYVSEFSFSPESFVDIDILLLLFHRSTVAPDEDTKTFWKLVEPLTLVRITIGILTFCKGRFSLDIFKVKRIALHDVILHIVESLSIFLRIGIFKTWH